jgi:hypothetical protein
VLEQLIPWLVHTQQIVLVAYPERLVSSCLLGSGKNPPINTQPMQEQDRSAKLRVFWRPLLLKSFFVVHVSSISQYVHQNITNYLLPKITLCRTPNSPDAVQCSLRRFICYAT